MKGIRETYIRYLSESISARCGRDKAHIDLYRPRFANNRNLANYTDALRQMTFTMSVAEAEGAYFNDLDGNRYLDMSMGFGVHLFGHKPAFIHEAMCRQMEKGLALGPLYTTAGELADLICKMTGSKRAAFYNSGTEAVMVAMRLARAATGRDKIIIFEGCYHGTHDSLLAMKFDEETHQARYTVPGVIQGFLDNTYIHKFGDSKIIEFIRNNKSELAAVLIEPVRSRHTNEIDPDFLRSLREVCSETDVALIFDEVISGFRIGNGGAAAYFGVQPDISTFGKVMGGGLPIGVVAGKHRFLDMVDGGQWRFDDESSPDLNTTFTAGTYNHHPLSMASSLAVLKTLDAANGSIQEELNKKTNEMVGRLNRFFNTAGTDISVSNFGSLFRFDLKGHQRLLYYALLNEGVYIWEGRNCFLSTEHGETEIEMFETAVRKATMQLVAAGIIKRIVNDSFPVKKVPLQAEIRIDGELSREKTDLSIALLFSSVTALQNSSFRVVHRESEEYETQIRDLREWEIRVSLINGYTDLHVAVNSSACDGRSLTLFFQAMAAIYSSVSNAVRLPEIKFESEREIWDRSQSVIMNDLKVYTTGNLFGRVLKSELAASNQHNCFQVFLEAFYNALTESTGQEPDCIGVPVAAQIVLRKPNVFGNCTFHAPVSMRSNDIGLPNNLKQGLNNQIENYLNLLRERVHCDFVFNIDKLDFDLRFGNFKVEIIDLHEKYSYHKIVCNVKKLKDEFIISLKYDNESYGEDQMARLLQQMKKKLCSEKVYANI